MTKKHFIIVAATISKIVAYNIRKQAAEDFARLAVVANPRFDRERFFAACNVKA